VYGSLPWQRHSNNGVAKFVVGDDLTFLRNKQTVFFSRPATMRSTAAVKSVKCTLSAPRLVASRAASLTKLARSAPVKPGVNAAICSGSTSLAKTVFFKCTFKIATRSLLSGRSTRTWRSKRPARKSAGSSISGRFVRSLGSPPPFRATPPA